ncbi:Outer membrane protein beta-barrel domain-containing protein [Propionispira arboris]|uniref:Outer membrane protein beta-barrel domain-containing protein n=1 Tax=Propionispira arboris TaxID=84035 RepID=A0A1H7C9W7_9FIRM|nr:outer membrane beta-barrel protein [Propionispira arboris]SEJ82445.1 Outer membrane protein beta-barrel domain-containing protein [Propionispira arboris]
MKKICLLTMGLALMTVTAFAAPQTDIQQGKTAVDLGVFNSKTAINGDDFDTNTKLDAGITTGLSDKYAIQYKYHALGSGNIERGNIKSDINTQEFNVLYKLTPTTDAFVGLHRIDGSIGSVDIDAKNKVQVGITSTVPLSSAVSAWGTLAAGSDLVTLEAGLSHPLSQSADLNVYYRYTKDNDLRVNGNKFDFENNGFGLGVTMKF